MWEAIKEFFFYILKWLGLIGMFFMAVIMVTVFFKETSGVWEPSETHIIEEKYTHKGLYFAQSYFIKMSNGDVHSVFKHDFNALEEGDTFKPTFNALSWKDFVIISFLSAMVSLLFFCCAYLFAYLLFHQKKWFRAVEQKRKRLVAWFVSYIKKSDKTKERWKQGALLTLIILLVIPYLCMAKNIVVKFVPTGKETTIAEIQAREIDKARGFRGRASDIYTLTYTFTDENNEVYQTKKDVAYHTYYKYEDISYIPIVYRKQFPYESFIDVQSVAEFVSPILRLSNISLVVMASLLIYFIKKYIDWWGIPFVRKGKSS